ncbi:MAG: two pore domain potassium channel family protein [Kineosporiaceae bacterium]|nr:two pore domain potassium channel family protein [Kineosporiaceae bacterium]
MKKASPWVHLVRWAVGLTALSMVVVLGGATAVWYFERDHPEANLREWHDSLWWAVVTVCTVGYGEHFPVTIGGRMIAVLVMMTGIAIIGAVAAMVAFGFGYRFAARLEEAVRHVESQQTSEIEMLQAARDRGPHAAGAGRPAGGAGQRARLGLCRLADLVAGPAGLAPGRGRRRHGLGAGRHSDAPGDQTLDDAGRRPGPAHLRRRPPGPAGTDRPRGAEARIPPHREPGPDEQRADVGAGGRRAGTGGAAHRVRVRGGPGGLLRAGATALDGQASIGLPSERTTEGTGAAWPRVRQDAG